MKNPARVRPEDVRGLRTFAADYPRCRTLFLYRGSQRLEIGGVRCVPVESFLSRLRPHQPPPDCD